MKTVGNIARRIAVRFPLFLVLVLFLHACAVNSAEENLENHNDRVQNHVSERLRKSCFLVVDETFEQKSPENATGLNNSGAGESLRYSPPVVESRPNPIQKVFSQQRVPESPAAPKFRLDEKAVAAPQINVEMPPRDEEAPKPVTRPKEFFFGADLPELRSPPAGPSSPPLAVDVGAPPADMAELDPPLPPKTSRRLSRLVPPKVIELALPPGLVKEEAPAAAPELEAPLPPMMSRPSVRPVAPAVSKSALVLESVESPGRPATTADTQTASNAPRDVARPARKEPHDYQVSLGAETPPRLPHKERTVHPAPGGVEDTSLVKLWAGDRDDRKQAPPTFGAERTEFRPRTASTGEDSPPARSGQANTTKPGKAAVAPAKAPSQGVEKGPEPRVAAEKQAKMGDAAKTSGKPLAPRADPNLPGWYEAPNPTQMGATYQESGLHADKGAPPLTSLDVAGMSLKRTRPAPESCLTRYGLTYCLEDVDWGDMAPNMKDTTSSIPLFKALFVYRDKKAIALVKSYPSAQYTGAAKAIAGHLGPPLNSLKESVCYFGCQLPPTECIEWWTTGGKGAPPQKLVMCQIVIMRRLGINLDHGMLLLSYEDVDLKLGKLRQSDLLILISRSMNR